MIPLNLSIEWTPCDLCGAEDWETLFTGSDRRHGLPGEFGVTKCRHCGHLQTNPRPTQKALPNFYPETYSSHSDKSRRVKSTRTYVLEKRNFIKSLGATTAFLKFRRLVPKWLGAEKGLLLDVGCGAGWLCALAEKVSWQAVGIDIVLKACKVTLQTWGIPALCSDGSSLPFKTSSFHLVTLHHVLEHFPSPRRALSEVRRVLRENGWVAIEVPNAASLSAQIFGSLWSSWELPRHLHHFTPDTLKRLMESVGFRKVRVVSARYKPYARIYRLVPPQFLRGSFVKRAVGIALGVPLWLTLPLLVVREQGEVLRAWGCK